MTAIPRPLGSHCCVCFMLTTSPWVDRSETSNVNGSCIIWAKMLMRLDVYEQLDNATLTVQRSLLTWTDCVERFIARYHWTRSSGRSFQAVMNTTQHRCEAFFSRFGAVYFWIRNSFYITTHLVVVVVVVVVVGDALLKSLRLRRFKSDQDEIWHDCSPSKYAPIYGVRFFIWRRKYLVVDNTCMMYACLNSIEDSKPQTVNKRRYNRRLYGVHSWRCISSLSAGLSGGRRWRIYRWRSQFLIS